jgi:hypothetical protein
MCRQAKQLPLRRHTKERSLATKDIMDCSNPRFAFSWYDFLFFNGKEDVRVISMEEE